MESFNDGLMTSASGATGATGTETNVAASIAGAAGTGTGTVTVIMSTGTGSTGTARAIGRPISTDTMVVTTTTGTVLTTGTVFQIDKTGETQSSISLPLPKANLAKEIHQTPIHNQSRLAAHLHDFLLQDSPDLTQINDAENKPVMGIINIPKLITIWSHTTLELVPTP